MRGTCRFWHYTRNLAANALDPANEARMLKYGYHADSEWNRELLFAAKKNLFGRRKENVEWRDGDGRVVAAEVGDGLKLVETMGRKRRDVLITCWAVRKWVLGTLAERE
ncbi:uncharacterized protein K452DRAFT_283097 [Aplosporella prunicola CBS 121167]|uniref:Uncharacterized protein n=1 Tax=Aplosporella prunicola CBS 121167 TaxID=1176127 RepID=A0A6A6BS38_9PEZI|nr:uncharacterized protein K452DRAFT_283097 [Aplosporella prunicola CBS 121167]KAF2146896.1 hypothetical protein K452DRAFT_283097 [Aplosporella prunicola CBS 121167]